MQLLNFVLLGKPFRNRCEVIVSIPKQSLVFPYTQKNLFTTICALDVIDLPGVEII